jgi:hypothetical protein
MCGQIVLWRRRDNVLAYIQVGLFISTILIPIFGTTVVADADPRFVDQYVRIVVIGALAYVAGLCFGAPLGTLPNRLSYVFARPFSRLEVPSTVLHRAHRIAVASCTALVVSFALFGYVPLFAADRQAAKYGVGFYQGGFQRGALLYHVALAASATVLPVMLAVAYRRRRPVDFAICGALAIGVLVTLSRGEAFTGPLVFFVALAIERRMRPWLIGALVATVFIAGALANDLVYTAPPVASPSLAARVGSSAPDVRDHIGFLQGFAFTGDEHIGVRTILSDFSVDPGEWDPADYGVRTLTGLHDVSGLASGGIRLPAPIWGYAAYGMLGVVVWSFLSGLFTGWGTVKIKNLLTSVGRKPGASLNLTLAATFYTATFGLLATFYFPERSNVVVLGIAFLLCVARRGAPAPPAESEPASEARVSDA